jgi:hypothetical protein
MAGSSGIQPGVHLFAAVTISRSAGRRDTRGRVRLAPCANGARPQVPDDGSTVWRSWTARPQTRPDCLQRRFDRAPLKRPRSDGLVRRRAEDGLDCLPHPRRASLSFPSAERHLDRRLIHQSTKWGLPPLPSPPFLAMHRNSGPSFGGPAGEEFVSFLSEVRVSSCFRGGPCGSVPPFWHEKTAKLGGFSIT